MIEVKAIAPEHFHSMSEFAYEMIFGQKRPKELERYNFAILTSLGEDPVSYVTCIEMDANTLYWQYGGTLPKFKNTIYSYKAYAAGLDWSLKHYARVSTKIENTNTAMLKMALKYGFLIVGVTQFKNQTLLDLLKEN